MSEKSPHKQWGGRFKEATHELMERINSSIGFDKKLWREDVRGSKAHAAMLAKQGIIGPAEAEKIQEGLARVEEELAQGKIEFKDSLEDIHTHVEVRLREIIGDAAGLLHTARSRNDQVALDLRLWVMQAGSRLNRALLAFQQALLELAEKHTEAIMPGYTHLQRAQPVLFAHHLLAYVEMAARDRQRVADCLKRTAVSPLGAAALAGTTFDVKPEQVSAKLGMHSAFANSMDAVSDRDFAAEFIFTLSLIQVHLSRLAEEMVLWSSQEFGFIKLSDAFATGSSIMPQKKNPDAAELIRGKTGRVMGDLVSIMTVLKGLPLSYNKDLQEDKEPLFDAFETVHDCLKVMAPMLTSLTVNEAGMRAAVKKGFLNATELADYLAGRGIPFRKAHEIAGQAVQLAEKKSCALEDLSLQDYQKLASVIEQDLFDVLMPEQAVNRRTSPGGTAASNVKAALLEARKRLWPESQSD